MEKVGCIRQFESELSLRSFAQPFPSGDKGCANRPFNSLYDPFGSPCRGQKPQKEGCKPPYSVLKPLRYKVGGPSEVYASSEAAVFCAGWDRMDTRHLALTSNERRE